ncbi:MAG: efflux RND transporter periplasmic adaptor subunit [Desulfocapsaceae bacterium]
MEARILLVVAAVLLTACGSEPLIEDETKARPAILLEVGQNTDEAYLSFPSSIQGRRGSELAFAVGGVVEEVFVTAAQEVEQGEVLARLDQRDFRSQVNSAQATYTSAKEAYQRALRLLEGDAIPRSEVERRKTDRDTAEAQLERAQKALDDTIIIAPFPGAVAQVSIEVLQTAQAGQTAITLLNTSQLKAAINLPSDFIALSKKYSSEEDNTFIVLDVAPDQRIPAEFKEISLEADVASQTYEALFSFTPPDNLVVLPGMNAMVWLRDPGSDVGADALSVPLAAIGVEQDEKFVWVVDQKTMAVSKRTVSLADGVGEQVTILSGLKLGETIVAAGVSQLSEGIKVRQWSKN